MSIYCTRCGEELTAPKFHNGYPYGYSCYEVVTGEKPKGKRKFVNAELVGKIPTTQGFHRITVKYNGRKYLIRVIVDCDGKPHSELAEFTNDWKIFMVTHDRNGKSIYKTIK